ncbi:MAG: NAD(P)H-dependent oxidoreductase subunit E [Magnetospirillum sp.]|nr:NAD(P)H-dependent oxidoreductase subunit E [Magnetospirillum sp.]
MPGGKPAATPKGRQVDPAARVEVAALLGARSRARDLLIEHLHLIQDAKGCLPTALLAALAEAMRLSLAEVYEVATFYAHFEVVDGPAPAPSTVVRVCDSLTCAMMGAARLHAALANADLTGAKIVRAPCMGACDKAPAVAVGHRQIAPASLDAVRRALAAPSPEPVPVSHPDLAAYRAAGGYRTLAACRAGQLTLDAVTAALDTAGLRGLGGAGFPTARKWRLVAAQPGPRLMVVNADEGEPGTFKDRHYLERDPHRFLEGALIAATLVGVEAVYIYLRDEYPAIRQTLIREIAALEAAGLSGGVRVHLRRGAGAYICGEESALIESIEGKRGLPRNRPPYVAQVGLFGRPTLVNNVETLCWVRDIVERGPAWFADQGRRGAKGVRSFSLSGRVREPGVKLAPAGITARELIDAYGGGMAPGHAFRAYLPGGASGGILPAALADLPLEFGALEPYGCFVGSHAVIVLSDQDDLRAAALNLMRFFEDESCGQCTPCRVGTEKAAALMARPDWDTGLLDELIRTMADASICGLGQAAGNPVRALLRHFPEVLR